MGAFHFTPVGTDTVSSPGLTLRVLRVGLHHIPSSFEDWSPYVCSAVLCGLFGLLRALFEHNPLVLLLGCGSSSVFDGRFKWPSCCLCGLPLLFVTRVSASLTARFLVRGEERWCVSCGSPLGRSKLLNTSSSSPTKSVLFRHSTPFSGALCFFLQLPSVVSTHSSFGSLSWEKNNRIFGAPTF